MSGRQSSATERALRHVARGMTLYAAAKREGIALSTIYRALKAQRATAQGSGRESAAERTQSPAPGG